MKLESRHFRMVLAVLCLGAMSAGSARAQTTSEVYGFVMTDVVETGNIHVQFSFKYGFSSILGGGQ
jgi:hypothetical protein